MLDTKAMSKRTALRGCGVEKIGLKSSANLLTELDDEKYPPDIATAKTHAANLYRGATGRLCDHRKASSSHIIDHRSG